MDKGENEQKESYLLSCFLNSLDWNNGLERKEHPKVINDFISSPIISGVNIFSSHHGDQN